MNSSNCEERRGAKLLLYLGAFYIERDSATKYNGAQGYI
jgi:hypothetical protein